MSKFDWRSAALLGSLILSGTPVRAQIARVPQNPSGNNPPNTSQVQPQPSGSEFEGARRLLLQGKYDDAIAALHALEDKSPAMRGLAHELGAAYYKKSDF